MPDWSSWALLGAAITATVTGVAVLASAAARAVARRRHPCRTCLGSGLLVARGSNGARFDPCPTCRSRKEP